MPRDLIAHPETPVVDEVGQLLLCAADYIEKHGWCQGSLMTPHGVCALGALVYTRHGANVYVNALHRLRKHLDEEIPRWNDAEGRTKEEVVATLRKAARS